VADDHPEASDEEVANEELRMVNSVQSGGDGAPSNTDGLRVVHLTKTFKKNTAVDNVSLGVKRGEVFALLGPNGAGKSTTISLIRGDIKPSLRGGDVFVDNVSVTKNLALARSHLGVCPQFDAIDQMTVTEHLRFYARVRGIPDIDHNVNAILRAVGLTGFRDRQAHALSGGNKRKLSLGIALMGDPAVLLLDEPSSGLDAAAKRIMWRTLAATVPGRSILLTTHSMEEADALAGRAGILARRMLAMGTVERLRSRFGNALHVHLVCRGAPRTTDEDVARVRGWIVEEFPGAQIEERTYHGQMRFSVPADSVVRRRGPGAGEEGVGSAAAERSAIGQLVVTLEENRERLGVEHYSVSPTTLDQVFLAVVSRHGVKEEGYGEEKKKKWWQWGS
jgi:ABC-type multidrug transport system ATPase subunit